MSTMSLLVAYKSARIILLAVKIMGMEYFGGKLKALRNEKGLTQQQLANKMELMKGSISAYEQNSKYPSLDVLIRLCNFFMYPLIIF
jgi:DNA-binding XRE family transcriptional regulator